MFEGILIKRKLKLAMSIIYSGQFDLDTILASIDSSKSNQHKLIRAYVIVQTAAYARLNNEEKPIQFITDEVAKWKSQLIDDELSRTVLKLVRAQTEKTLLEAELEFNIDKLAPEDSLEGIVFSAEKNKGGPLTEKELEGFTKLTGELSDLETKIEERKSASHDSELKECLEDIKEVLSKRSQERIRELETIRNEIKAGLLRDGVISQEDNFFPPFGLWQSKRTQKDSSTEEDIVSYTEELEQFYKECIAAKELGLNPPKIDG